MFEHIGKKIKTLAVVLCIILIVICVAVGGWLIYLGISLPDGSEQQPTMYFIGGGATIVLGALLSWIGSFFIYGYGEAIDKIMDIERDMKIMGTKMDKTEDAVKDIYETTEKIRQNGGRNDASSFVAGNFGQKPFGQSQQSAAPQQVPFAAPQQTPFAAQQPAQPQYKAPVQPAVQATPVTPVTPVAPAQPVYTAPAQPAQPQYKAPVAPAQPVYTAPVQPAVQVAPVTPAAPAQPVYAAAPAAPAAQPISEAPAAPVYAAPAAPVEEADEVLEESEEAVTEAAAQVAPADEEAYEYSGRRGRGRRRE